MPTIPPDDRDSALRPSQDDPLPERGRGGPPVSVVVLVIIIIIFTIVVLHVTGVVGGGH